MTKYLVIALIPEWEINSALNVATIAASNARDALSERLNWLNFLGGDNLDVGPGKVEFVVVNLSTNSAYSFKVKVPQPPKWEII